MILQVLAAAIGAIAFAFLFEVPRKYFFCCGICGGVGWLVYSLACAQLGLGNTISSLLAAGCMAFCSRLFAIRMGCPVTVFLTSGTIPLVPGARVFWMAYYMVIGDNPAALSSGVAAVKAAGAIVLGIILIYELPAKLFQLLAGVGQRKDKTEN